MVDVAGFAQLLGINHFDVNDFGQVYIDRRFVTDEEMKTVAAIENWLREHFPNATGSDMIATVNYHSSGS